MGVNRCRQFRDMLHSSLSTGTGIGRCVRKLVLVQVRLRLDVPEDSEASDIPLLEEIFSALPNVGHLRLRDVVVECMPKMHPGDALDDGYPAKPPRSLFTLPRLRTLHIHSVSFDSTSDIILLLVAFPQVSNPRLSGPARWPPQIQENRKADSLICIRELGIHRAHTLSLLSALRQPPFKRIEGTLEDLVVDWFTDSFLSETMDLSQHSCLKSLSVTAIRSDCLDKPSFKVRPSYLTFLSRAPSSLRTLRLPITLSLDANDTTEWSFMDWPSLDETLTLLHKKNPCLTVSIVIDFLLQPGDTRWVPDVVKSSVVQPLSTWLRSSVLAGLPVSVVFGAYPPRLEKPVKKYCWDLHTMVSTPNHFCVLGIEGATLVEAGERTIF
ncbi:uncharacterized protein B0H18DRAFT_1034950 [Fomitopsis serialis]|uniref:uncharacterized protein n=1 Tax=Fomitopsis serialis TaxID=139415 RepID=UPI00200774B2|nr:uncharacterized protein B0H18DRAFT_1034950 [Neoantrodia serialis]KAH9917330.1 hypothetical protein B0H18DRAFT_1034950 [Neoantrodia serialis]